jgi:hypothetical protein
VSDFLGRLIQRTTAATPPIIRPRLASRFEPQYPSPGPIFLDEVDADLEVHEDAQEAPPVKKRPVRSSRAGSPEPADADSVSVQTPVRRSTPLSEEMPEMRPLAPVPSRHELLPSSALEPPPRVQPVAPPPRPAARELEGPAIASAHAAPKSEPVIVPVTSEQDSSVRRKPPALEPALYPAPANPHSPVRPPSHVAEQSVVVQPAPVSVTISPTTLPIEPIQPSVRAPFVPPPSLEPATPRTSIPAISTPPHVQTNPQPDPVIQISIGRIEVRATPASGPATTRQKAATPVMSLDQYLRQRSRGGRR